MNHKIAIVAFVLALTAGALIYQPISGSSSASDSADSMPSVYLADVEGDVCVSDSPVHTTQSLTTAEVDSESSEGMPSIYLVMLEDGICASSSPISTPSQTSQLEEPASLPASAQSESPEELKEGVWYIQY